MKPQLERLRDAYAIIDGIPDDRIDLRYMLRHHDPEDLTKVVASPLGWLAIYPSFMAECGPPKLIYLDGKLSIHWSTVPNRPTMIPSHTFIAASFFSLTMDDVRDLFGPRNNSRYDWALLKHASLTDKHLWLGRVRKYLGEQPHLPFIKP